ncbi:hypothetical protein [Aliidongia dinghuensis]|nr:hypothetical protein [Aliidongia dinghuensis]
MKTMPRLAALLGLVFVATTLVACSTVTPETTTQHFASLVSRPGPM